MKVNLSDLKLSVSQPKPTTSIGGVVVNAKMYVLYFMIVMMPAHVAMLTGSVNDLAQCVLNRQSVMTGETPEWTKSLKEILRVS